MHLTFFCFGSRMRSLWLSVFIICSFVIVLRIVSYILLVCGGMWGVSVDKSAAGRLGGKKTLEVYGKEYYSELGRRGAAAFWEKYYLVPVNLTQFAIVRKIDNRVVSIKRG